MRYLVRAFKYFLYLTVILALLIAVLVLFKVVESDPQKLFRNGYDSYWQIALLMAVLGAVYPRFGYQRRKVHMAGSDEELRPVVNDAMEAKGYFPEKVEGETLTFRSRSTFKRISRMFEDRITFTRSVSGYEIEGPSKDIVRIASVLRSSHSATSGGSNGESVS